MMHRTATTAAPIICALIIRSDQNQSARCTKSTCVHTINIHPPSFSGHSLLRAIPFEYTWGGGGGGGVDCSPIKKSWGEGVKIEKNHWARGLSNIEKHGGGGGGGGGYLAKKTSGVGYILHILKRVTGPYTHLPERPPASMSNFRVFMATFSESLWPTPQKR